MKEKDLKYEGLEGCVRHKDNHYSVFRSGGISLIQQFPTWLTLDLGKIVTQFGRVNDH